MKLIETLSKNELNELLTADYPNEIPSVGIFPYMFKIEDALYNLKGELSRGYYLGWSGQKSISIYFKKLIEYQDNPLWDSPAEIIGSMVRSKFIDKWNRLYSDLKKEYNPLIDYDMTETVEADNTDTKTYDVTNTDSGTSYNEDISRSNGNENNAIYGFNSNAPSNTDYSTDNSSDTTNTESEFDNTSSKTGTETFGISKDETKTTQGRRASASALLKDELDFRAKNLLYDIIYRDIDSIVVSQIYER